MPIQTSADGKEIFQMNSVSSHQPENHVVTHYNVSQLKEQFTDIHKERDKQLNEIGFFWNRKLQEIRYFNKEQFQEQLRHWKNIKKYLLLDEYNNGEKEIEGRTMYYTTIQFKDNDGEMIDIDFDYYALSQGYIVVGQVYWFYDVRNRDRTCTYLKKITS